MNIQPSQSSTPASNAPVAKSTAEQSPPITGTASSSGALSTFDVLSLNTFGLPAPLGKDIAERHERIGRSLGGYEIAGFQETFSADSKQLKTSAQASGQNFNIHEPSERRLLTSGLSTFSKYEIVASGFRPFVLGSHADALAEKGVSFTRVRLPSGETLDVYNTHFQAARDKPKGLLDEIWMKSMAQIFPGYDMPRDQIRAHDAQVLIDYVNENDQGNPVIIMGDFNTQEHQAVYQQVRDALGVEDAFRAMNPTDPGYTSDGLTNPHKSDPEKRKRVDYIFYRDGKDLDLTVTQSELTFNQAVDGMFVSDHYGVATRFQLTPKSTTSGR